MNTMERAKYANIKGDYTMCQLLNTYSNTIKGSTHTHTYLLKTDKKISIQ